MHLNHRGSRHLAVLMISFGALAGPGIAAAAAPHDHGHGDAPAALVLDQGRKWGTDQPLRQAMGRIRQVMDKSVHAIHENRLGAAGYRSLARTIDGQVKYMISHCRLAPAADAQLHLIIAEMLAGAEAMSAQGPLAARRDGAVRVIGALANYGDYFEHPGWLPLAH